MKRLFFALALALPFVLLAGATHAATITPLAYTATPGEGQAQGGSYNYFDDGGRQLIDGRFGVNNWQANLGNGNAQEWVGWLRANPTITFDFGSNVSIGGIILGLNRANGAGIHIALSGSLDGEGFSIPANAFADNTRADLTFNFAQPLIGSSFTLSLSDGNSGRWLFIDEIQFLEGPGTTVVPVPGALAMLVPGLALVGVAARRRRTAALA